MKRLIKFLRKAKPKADSVGYSLHTVALAVILVNEDWLAALWCALALFWNWRHNRVFDENLNHLRDKYELHRQQFQLRQMNSELLGLVNIFAGQCESIRRLFGQITAMNRSDQKIH